MRTVKKGKIHGKKRKRGNSYIQLGKLYYWFLEKRIIQDICPITFYILNILLNFN
jgi:hypothetical protein